MTSSWFPAKLLEANCKPEKHEHQAKPQQWGLATLMTLPREKWSSDSGLFLVWMWTGVGMCTRAFGGSGWCCWSSSIIFYLRLWDWVSHWSWGSLIRQDWLASMPWGICLSPHLQYCDYMSMLLSDFFYVGACVWTWYLMFARQALYWLSHLPNAPQFMFFNVLSLDHLQ